MAESKSIKASERTQHTPGPWSNSGFVIFADKIVVARCDIGYTNSLEAQKIMEVNARLIAAAPELLEACRALISPSTFGQEGHIDFVSAVKMAQTAIAKAEGQAQ